MINTSESRVCGFDASSFRHEFAAALSQGIAELTSCESDSGRFHEAYGRLSAALENVVEKWKPPMPIVIECKEVATNAVQRRIYEQQVDIRPFCEADLQKLCISLMKATGGYAGEIERLDRISANTLEHLQNNGFTLRESKRLLRDLMSFGSPDIKGIVAEISRNSEARFSDFLRFLAKAGTPVIKAGASAALEDILSETARPQARVLRLSERRPARETNPIRQF